MNRSVGFLLMLSVSLFTAPLKADSYQASDGFADPSTVNSETQCNVSPQAPNQQQPSEEQGEAPEAYAQQDFSGEMTEDQAPAETQETQGNYADQGTLVNPENPDHAKRSRNRYWKNILLAVVVIAVAVTALLVVNSHEGHKSHH